MDVEVFAGAFEADLLPPKALSDGAVTAELRLADREWRRWGARRVCLIGEAEERGLARREGYPSTTAWLMAVSGEPAAVCRSQVGVAEALQEMPETRAAFQAGDLSESRVRVLAQAQALCPEQFARDEARLVAEVTAAPSQQVPRVLARWKRSTDLGAAEAEAERLHGRRGLHVSEDWSGMLRLSGLLDPGSGLVVLNTLQALTDPAHLDPNDRRTPAQARADALVEVCRRYEQAGGRRRGPQVLVTIPWNTLHTGQGVVDTACGPIGAPTALRLCCDATISRVLLDPESVPIELGRATRVVSHNLRRLLEARDQGCTWPGCDRPASWCDAHHIQHWAQGGPTDPSNLRLLCSHHHTQTHEQSWRPRRQ